MQIHSTGSLLLTSLFLWVSAIIQSAQAGDVKLIVHLRGVYECKVSVLALSPAGTFNPIVVAEGIKNGDTARISIASQFLPGNFVLRFDYIDKPGSTPYPSEKNILANQQDLELWVNPKYPNHTDSTRFQPEELENATFAAFALENATYKEQLALLQQFLMSYDDTGSAFYLEGIKEFEQRRLAFNQWLVNRTRQDQALFVSSLYRFQYVPEITWKGTETDRIKNLITHYFDGMDFKDPLMIRTADVNKWMDNYVNLYGQMATTIALRDSLFPEAGRTAIEKAKKGDPMVYGWMVDYFFRGYEANNITAGMKILEPYLNDPDCLTSKRQEITRRLKGIETLVPGTTAPNIILQDADGKAFELYTFETPCAYILLLFWSADCSHCAEVTDQVFPWQQKPEIQPKIAVVAISLDETETETAAWKKRIPLMFGWKHLRAPEGIRSDVAADYYILATPVMVLIDAKTRKIIALPNTLKELIRILP
jgi:hypothetical protein